MAHEVFISYSNEDKFIADVVCNSLEKNGIRCWIAPRDVLPGTNWGESIIEAINECKVLVLISSQNSNQSLNVMGELERATATDTTIIPFSIGEVDPSKQLELFIAGYHWIDDLTSPLEKQLDILTKAVASALNINETSNTENNSESIPLVLISYSSKGNSRDTIIAHTVCSELEANGIKCWIAPRDIKYGKDRSDAIIDAIEMCKIMVVIFSESVNKSPDINMEIYFAADEGLDIITFRIDEAFPERGLKLLLSRKQWINAVNSPMDPHIQNLMDIINDIVDIQDIENTSEKETCNVKTAQKPLNQDNISDNIEYNGLINEEIDEKSEMSFSPTNEIRKSNEFNQESKNMINLKEEPLVFISHVSKDGSKDKKAAHDVRGELENNGIKCWIAPRDIKEGEKWDDAIAVAIEKCNIMVLIFSEQVNKSDWVQKEIQYALGEGLEILPFKIDNSEPEKGLKLNLGTIQYFDASSEPMSLHIQKFAKNIKYNFEQKKED